MEAGLGGPPTNSFVDRLSSAGPNATDGAERHSLVGPGQASPPRPLAHWGTISDGPITDHNGRHIPSPASKYTYDGSLRAAIEASQPTDAKEAHILCLIRDSFKLAAGAQPLSQLSAAAETGRMNGCPGYVNAPRNNKNEPQYENYDGAKALIRLISRIMADKQAMILKDVKYISVTADGSTDRGASHNITIEVRYIMKDGTHTEPPEPLKLVECPGDGLAVAFAIMQALGPKLMYKLVGGAFDGANSMLGVHSGVAAILKEYAPFSEFVHCMAHRAALVSKHAAAGDEVAIWLHSVLQNLFSRYSRSGKRAEHLHEIQKRYGIKEVNPSGVFEVRWLSCEKAMKYCCEILPSLFMELEADAKENSDPKSREAAAALLAEVLDAKFVCLLYAHTDMVKLQADFSREFQDKDVCIGDIAGDVEEMRKQFTSRYVEGTTEHWGENTKAMIHQLGKVKGKGKNKHLVFQRPDGDPGEPYSFDLACDSKDKEVFKASLVKIVRGYAGRVVEQIDKWWPEGLRQKCNWFGVFDPRILKHQTVTKVRASCLGKDEMAAAAAWYGTPRHAKVFQAPGVGSDVLVRHTSRARLRPAYDIYVPAKISSGPSTSDGGEPTHSVQYTAEGEAQLVEQLGNLDYYEPTTVAVGGGAELVGRKVHVAWEPSLLTGTDKVAYYPATITEANDNGTYRVKYDVDDIDDVDKDTTSVTTQVEPHLLFTKAVGAIPGAGVCNALPTGLTNATTTHVLVSSMYQVAPALLDGAALLVEFPMFLERVVGHSRYKSLLEITTVRSFAESVLADPNLRALYPNVCELLAIMLTIPASSAESERTFSCQNLIKTKDRTRLDVEFLDCLVRIYRLSRIHYYRDYVGTLHKGSSEHTKAMRSPTTLAMCCRGFDAKEVLARWVYDRDVRKKMLSALRASTESGLRRPADLRSLEETLDEELMGQTEHSSQEPDDSAEDACLDIVNSGEDEDARSQAKVDTPQAVGVDTGTSELHASNHVVGEDEGEAEGDQENEGEATIMADSGDEHFGDFGIDDEALLAHVY